MRLACYAARIAEARNAFHSLVKTPRDKDHLGDIFVDGRVIIKCVLVKYI
jgi:hypothetical protein